MKFKSIFINTDKLYSVGIDEETGKYCMAVVVTWIASYTRYFELTRQEYELYKNDKKKLDDIAVSFLKHQNPKDSERFLYSEMKNEN